MLHIYSLHTTQEQTHYTCQFYERYSSLYRSAAHIIFLLLLALPHLRSLHHQAFKPSGNAAKQPLINPPRTARLHSLGGAGLGCPPPLPSAAGLSCSAQHGLESSLTALSTPSFMQIPALALTATATNALRRLTLWTLRTEDYE